MECQAEGPGDYNVLNPAALACWADEDFVGRVARVARKCHPIQQAFGTMTRCLMMYKSEWKRQIIRRR